MSTGALAVVRDWLDAVNAGDPEQVERLSAVDDLATALATAGLHETDEVRGSQP